MRNTAKLTDLRTKTDRQLLQLISHRLDAGLALARAGRISESERAYVEAGRLLMLLQGASAVQPAAEQSRLATLRRLLDERQTPIVRAACF